MKPGMKCQKYKESSKAYDAALEETVIPSR